MAERLSAQRVARVIGPEGEPIGPEDLPEHADIRWVRRRKARVVAAVRDGQPAILNVQCRRAVA